MNERHRQVCNATRADGNPCQGWVGRNGQHCTMHDPEQHDAVRSNPRGRGRRQAPDDLLPTIWRLLNWYHSYTLDEFAKIVGVNRFTLRRWLKGECVPQQRSIDAIYELRREIPDGTKY